MCINRIGQAGPSIYYSNSQRHGILADEDLKERVDLLESKDKENSSELKDNRRETEVLKRRVEVLETACEGYRRIRRRFFDTYKRDILRLPHVLASRDIHTGNEAAHEGNVVIDADIYDIESRNDLYVFQNLYGLEVGQVMKYKNAGVDGGIFDLLNAHATLVANGQITPDITSAFQTFRIQASESFLQPPNHDLISPLGLAYSRFLEVHSRQTRR